MNTNSHENSDEKPAAHGDGVVNFVSVPEMYRLLGQAAEVAVGAGLPPEAFAAAAWQAFLRASPGLAERMAEAQLEAALEELRTNGRLGKA